MNLEAKSHLLPIFLEIYDLLTAVMKQADDTLWYDLETTAHEQLVNIAYSHDQNLGAFLQAKIEADCGEEDVITAEEFLASDRLKNTLESCLAAVDITATVKSEDTFGYFIIDDWVSVRNITMSGNSDHV